MGRRRTGFALLVVIVFAVAGCGWPANRYGPAHSGSNDFEHSLTKANVATIVPRWSATIATRPIGSPVVAQGMVFVSGFQDTSTGPTAVVQAFRTADGSAVWSHVVDANPGPTSPTAAFGRIIVGDGARVLALDAATGHQEWAASTTGPLASAPDVVGGRVYFSTTTLTRAGSPSVLVGALDLETGAPVWSREVTGVSGYGATIGGGRLFLALDGTPRLVALALPDGRMLYEAPLATGSTGDVASLLAYRRGQLWAVETQESVGAFDAATGAQRWRSTVHGPGTSFSPTLTRDELAVCQVTVVSRFEVYVRPFAFDLSDGTERWHQDVRCDAITHANGVLYVASGNTLRFLDASSGQPIGDHAFATGSSLQVTMSDPVVANGSVYVAITGFSPSAGQLVRLGAP